MSDLLSRLGRLPWLARWVVLPILALAVVDALVDAALGRWSDGLDSLRAAVSLALVLLVLLERQRADDEHERVWALRQVLRLRGQLMRDLVTVPERQDVAEAIRGAQSLGDGWESDAWDAVVDTAADRVLQLLRSDR